MRSCICSLACLWLSFHSVFVYQNITLYAVNTFYPAYFSKAGRKKKNYFLLKELCIPWQHVDGEQRKVLLGTEWALIKTKADLGKQHLSNDLQVMVWFLWELVWGKAARLAWGPHMYSLNEATAAQQWFRAGTWNNLAWGQISLLVVKLEAR